MADALNRTPDFPTFDTYPLPAAEHTLPAEGQTTTARGIGFLNDTAASIGGTVGMAVSQMRDLQRELERTFNLIRDRARSAAEEKVAQLRNAAETQAAKVKDAASERIRQARVRVQYVSREYPFQVIAGVAATAFVAGMMLRLWRSNRA
jgi:ElaB/YqjD/DUF883 family membrane-anchored ribosome-binding protein